MGAFVDPQSIVPTYRGLQIPITHFAVIDLHLVLTLNEIAQVWDYQLVVIERKIYIFSQLKISNRELGLVEGFSPLEVVGNFDIFGPLLFINNQLEVVIISIKHYAPNLISTTRFPLTMPQLSTNIFLTGENLIVVQSGVQT